MRTAVLPVAIALGLVVFGCTSPVAPPANNAAKTAPTGLQVGVAGNATPLIAPESTLHLWATVTYADGRTSDVTNAAGWQSSNPVVGTVSREGVVTAAAEGAADFIATYGQLSGTLRV